MCSVIENLECSRTDHSNLVCLRTHHFVWCVCEHTILFGEFANTPDENTVLENPPCYGSLLFFTLYRGYIALGS